MEPTGQGVDGWVRANKSKIKSYTTQVIDTEKPDLYPAFPLHVLQFQTASDSGLHLFYIHGGGFVYPLAGQGHMPAIYAISQALGGSTAYIPEYTLSPAKQYPSLPVQIIEGMRHVLRTVPPERIVIAGDSAGGNLATVVLAHLLKPCPYTSPLTLPNDNFLAGALLICPYNKFHKRGAPLPRSIIENAKYDYVTREGDLQFQDMYAPSYGEVWAEPGCAPADFWRDLPVKKVAVIGGDWELLRDDILVFGEKLRKGAASDKTDIQILLAEKAMHVELAVDLAVGIQTGDTLKKIRQWCGEVRQSVA